MATSSDALGYSNLEPAHNNFSPWRDFILMSIAFSVNHGTVTGVLAIASAEKSPNLAAWTSATLYGMYTISALLFAVPLVNAMGPKWSLVWGLALYCFWPGVFALTQIKAIEENTNYTWEVSILGSVIGGFGAGWIWPAQGAYFGRVAKIYARQYNMTLEEASGYLGGIFATIYVGFEVVMKMLSSLILHFWDQGHTFLFVIYFIAAAVSAAGMVFVNNLPEDEIKKVDEEPEKKNLMFQKLNAVGEVICDRRIWLIGMINVAFGFTSSFLNWYLNGTVAKRSIGEENVGFLSAIVPAYAATMSYAYIYLGNKLGKAVMMCSGGACFLAIGLISGIFSEDHLVSGGWALLIVIYLLHGSGRAVFESTNRGVVVDFFPNNQAGAFALVAMQNGIAGTIGFIVFSDMIHLEPNIAAWIIVLISSLSIVTMTTAFVLEKREKQAREEQERFVNENTSPKNL